MKAKDILDTAADLVGGDRQAAYGDKDLNMGKIAALWNAWLAIRRDPTAPLDGEDVAQLMSLMKKARTQSGKTGHIDNYIDDAGYSGIAGEIADGKRQWNELMQPQFQFAQET